jgi:hypothetical protein
MKAFRSLAILFGVNLFLFSSSVRADEWNKKTTITFSGPVQVANTPLPAGTYTFRLAGTVNRNVVQIFNEDESHIIATIIAIPDYRLEPADHTVVKFAEAREGSEASGTLPESGIPMKEWFYPGDNSGQEFRVVPQPEVAAGQPEPVAAPAPPPEPPAESPEAAPPPEPQAAAPAPEEPAAPEAAAVPPQAQQTESAAEQPAAEQSTAPAQLSQTASQTPLVGLIGLVALAAAASLRIILKVSA